MPRLGWKLACPDEPSSALPWQTPALILSTLFLNFPFLFLHTFDFHLPGSTLRHSLGLAGASLLITGLFFLGPALRCQSSRRSLFQLADAALGRYPALLLRLAALACMVLWMASITDGACVLYGSYGRGPLPPRIGQLFVFGAIFACIFFTALQNLPTTARLARFTLRLMVAILIAAAWRTREGFPQIAAGFADPTVGAAHTLELFLKGFQELSLAVAPLALLAALLASRIDTRVGIFRIGIFGLVIPLAGALAVSAALCVATCAAGYYQPSLEPSLAMSLWTGTATHARLGYVLITLVTLFGALRFGAIAIAETLPPSLGPTAKRAALGLAVAAIAVLVSYPILDRIPPHQPVSALVGLAAVLTLPVPAGIPKIDWPGTLGVAASIAISLYAWDTWWVLPAWAAAFMVTWAGRRVIRRNL